MMTSIIRKYTCEDCSGTIEVPVFYAPEDEFSPEIAAQVERVGILQHDQKFPDCRESLRRRNAALLKLIAEIKAIAARADGGPGDVQLLKDVEMRLTWAGF